MIRVSTLGSAFAIAIIASSGCDVRHVDLGVTGNGGGVSPQKSPTGKLGTAYGCGDWIDDELNEIRLGTCEGRCADVPAQPYVLDHKAAIMAGTAGRWAFCRDHLGPPDALGIEFGPGCRIFFLRDDEAGVAVRGTESEYQADYDMFDRPGTANIDLHFSPTNTEAFTVEAFRCPERVVLRQGERVIELGRLDGHGGTGVPVR